MALPRTQRSRTSVVTRADFIGSSENLVCPGGIGAADQSSHTSAQIMATSTTLVLVAGRFGLAPTVNRPASKGLKLYEDKSAGIMSNDPAGALLLCVTRH